MHIGLRIFCSHGSRIRYRFLSYGHGESNGEKSPLVRNVMCAPPSSLIKVGLLSKIFMCRHFAPPSCSPQAHENCKTRKTVYYLQQKYFSLCDLRVSKAPRMSPIVITFLQQQQQHHKDVPLVLYYCCLLYKSKRRKKCLEMTSRKKKLEN